MLFGYCSHILLLSGVGVLWCASLQRYPAIPMPHAAVAVQVRLEVLCFSRTHLHVSIHMVQGRRVIENLDEVAAMLRRRYPTARVQIVSFGKHPDLTMAEQVGRRVGVARQSRSGWGRENRVREHRASQGKAGRAVVPAVLPG